MNFLKKAAEQFSFVDNKSYIIYFGLQKAYCNVYRAKLGPLWITLTTLISSLTIYLVYSQVFKLRTLIIISHI